MAFLLGLLHLGNLDSLLLFCAVFILVYVFLRRPRYLPPGPFITLPFFGNILYLVGKDPRIAFDEMRRRYGEVFCMYVGKELLVILNGYQTIREALIKKGAFFSNRPQNFYTTEIVKQRGIAWTSGKLWHQQRHFSLHALNTNGFSREQLESNISKEISMLTKFLQTKVEQSIDISQYLQVSAFNIIWRIIGSKSFGYDDVEPKAYIQDLDRALKLVATTGLLFNTFPFLQYLPFNVFGTKEIQRISDRRRAFVQKIYRDKMKDFNTMDPKDFMDFYTLEILRRENEGNSCFTEDQLFYAVGDLIAGGTETTNNTIRWAMIHLMENPKIQLKLQTEILKVIGQDREPTLEDQSKLPFVEATIMEVLRLSSPLPLAVPHATKEDVVFRGFRIPKGSTVLANLDSVFRDKYLWSSPHEFRPERFIDDKGFLVKPNALIPFGIGKRICPGESLARASLFLFMTSLYQKFSFVVPENEGLRGRTGVLKFTYQPNPFKVRIVSGRVSE